MNVQNIPRKLKEVKRGFIPQQDAFLFFDYKAIEVRLLAYYMSRAIGDTSLADEIKGGLDPHLETAKGLFPGQDISEEQRQAGKTMNFSIIYGGGKPTIMRQLGVDYREAARLLSAYHAHRPGIKTLNLSVANTLAERGFIRTLYGRRLHPQEEHKALNALIQGCAADLMRSSVVKVHSWLANNSEARIVNIVHDELMIDCSSREIPLLVSIVPGLMRDATIEEHIPIEVDCEVSYTTWADKEEYVPEG